MSLRDRLRRAALVILDADEKPQRTPPASSASPPPVAPAAPQARVCGSCAHFDLAAGQEALRAQPAMMQAAATIPPWAMGRKVKREPNGALIPPEGTTKEWLAAKWVDLGGCTHHQRGMFPFDTCPQFTPRESAR